MAATPEIPRPEAPKVYERPEEFPETIQQKIQGAKVVQKTFKAQVKDDTGAPLIQTPPTTVISVTPPSDDATLLAWSKGDTASAMTWLAAFWMRIIKKAMHFGWQIVSGSPNPPITN